MNNSKCYNCGIELDSSNSTAEHIPPKCMFEGYDDTYKVNRITVRGCRQCNVDYSLLDEEFRNLIGVIAKNADNLPITEKSVRSILRKDKKHLRLMKSALHEVHGVEFNEKNVTEFHKKNFKGLFVHEYGQILPQEYELKVYIDENDTSKMTKAFLGFCEKFKWKVSGHSTIFRYKLQPFREGIQESICEDISPEGPELIYICIMDYNEEHAALVIAFNKSQLPIPKQVP